MGEIIEFHRRRVNNVCIDQRKDNGFVNATAMAKAHGKKINDWLRNSETLELMDALAEDLDIKCSNYGNSRNSNISRLSATKVSELYPDLVFVKRGSADNGGGIWIHPDLSIDCASWCNKRFAIQVSRWIQEWFATGKNPFSSDKYEADLEKELELWEKRYGIRLDIKDNLRIELMKVTVDWCKQNDIGAKPVCINVHQLMNLRIQGYEAKQLKIMGGLPIASLLRNYLGANSLQVYASIYRGAINLILDRDLHPEKAVNEACDVWLGKRYQPKPLGTEENLYAQGRRLKKAKKKKQIQQGKQLELKLYGDDQAI